VIRRRLDQQGPTVGTTAERIMSDPAFRRGVADYRAGRAPDYDAFTFSQDEDVIKKQSRRSTLTGIMSEVGTGQRSRLMICR